MTAVPVRRDSVSDFTCKPGSSLTILHYLMGLLVFIFVHQLPTLVLLRSRHLFCSWTRMGLSFLRSPPRRLPAVQLILLPRVLLLSEILLQREALPAFQVVPRIFPLRRRSQTQ